jgi:single-strand DNA-binding protein
LVGLNRIMVIGNVGTDPEMRYTPSGAPVTSFRIAVSRAYNTREGERRQETEWFTVVAWNALAEQVNQYLSKGRRAFVEGRFHSHSFQGNDGQMRFRSEIIASTVRFLDRPGTSDEGGEYSGGTYAQGAGGTDYGGHDVLSPDDLPF